MKTSRTLLSAAVAATLFAAAFWPVATFAANVRTGGVVTTARGDFAEGNVYVVAGQAALAGAVGDDLLVVAAADSVVSGAVGGDLTVAGYQTLVSGEVSGDLRAAAGLVIVSGKIGGDLVAAGGRVVVLPEATIGGDLVAAGGELVTRGDVAGGISLFAGSAAVGGRQGGGVVTAPSVRFLSDAAGGGVSYYAQNPAVVEPGAALASLSYNRVPPISEIGPVKRGLLTFLTLWRFFSFASTLILALALAYGAKVFSQETSEIGSRGLASFFGSFAAGFAALLLLPLASLLAVASIFALPLGVLGLLATVALLVLAAALGALVVGAAVERALRRGAEVTVSYRAAALGAVVLALVGLLPFGAAFKAVAAIAGVGAAARVATRRLRGDGWSVDKVLSRWGGKGR